MKNILITEAGGKAGREVFQQLINLKGNYKLYVAVNNHEKYKDKFSPLSNDSIVYYDIEDEYSYKGAFENIDTIFLILPPKIKKPKKFYGPLIKAIRESNISEIIFLSVKGAENSIFIPHNRVEALIKKTEIDYVFIRASYFMQNLRGPLYHDIKKYDSIRLPAGIAKFNWVDINNIAEVAVHIIIKFKNYKNNVIDVCGSENLDFYEVTDIFNDTLNREIYYQSQNLFSFYRQKRKQGLSKSQITVLILLHFLPRFKDEPVISNAYQTITYKKPNTLRDYLLREMKDFK